MHRLLWHMSCAKCLTRGTTWPSVGKMSKKQTRYVKHLLSRYRANVIILKLWGNKLAFFCRGLCSKEKDWVISPTTSSAASARSRQNSMVLAISSLLGVSSSRSISSLSLCLNVGYRRITDVQIQLKLSALAAERLQLTHWDRSCPFFTSSSGEASSSTSALASPLWE